MFSLKSMIPSVISKHHEDVSRYKNNLFIEIRKNKIVSKHIFKTKNNIKMINYGNRFTKVQT